MSSETEIESPRRRWDPAALSEAVGRDPRTALLIVALAAVATLAALLSEWQVTRIDVGAFSNDESGPRSLTSGVADFGGLGAGYLTGVFLLAAAVALVLSGPAEARRYARSAGLGVGTALLGVLAAGYSVVVEQSMAIPRIYALQVEEAQLVVSPGRGLYCALAGVAAAMLALYLADRRPAGEPVSRPSFRARADEDRPPDEPLELSVGPAVPFAAPSDRDEPTGGEDIGMNTGPVRR